MPRVLVTLAVGPGDREILEQQLLGADLRFAASPAVEDVRWAEVVLGNANPAALAESSVRWLHSPSVGLDVYDGLCGSRPDIEITNAVGVVDRAVAEHGLALLLALTRNVPVMVDAQRKRRWGREAYRDAGEGTLIEGKRAHVLGYGRVARCIADLLVRLSMRVSVYRRAGVGDDPRVESFHPLSELVRRVGEAEVLVNVLPLRDETRAIVGRAVFGALPAGAYYLNLGRGPTTDEDALVDALRTGRLAGAALDVFAAEPLPDDSPLWTLPTVIVSPHVAGRFDVEVGRYVRGFVDRYGERFG